MPALDPEFLRLRRVGVRIVGLDDQESRLEALSRMEMLSLREVLSLRELFALAETGAAVILLTQISGLLSRALPWRLCLTFGGGV
mmetsp:Transcript_18535/g.29551  ORF Transcript_18535/g.29551 Transcript_18535/m.29551 type:complete len:85 (+) Transcript_18535:436-690(+)